MQHWGRPATTLVLPWYYAGAVLFLQGYFTGTAPVQHWCFAGAVLVLVRNCICTALLPHWYCRGTTLVNVLLACRCYTDSALLLRTLVLHWYCMGAEAVLHWHCATTKPVLNWHKSGIYAASVLARYMHNARTMPLQSKRGTRTTSTRCQDSDRFEPRPPILERNFGRPLLPTSRRSPAAPPHRPLIEPTS